ncbi:hypothetical protein AHMF7616_00050 [Adhaeribacter pallidiroseus]|uniref:Uncharacterized protein n=1 Tax=Adhaeribacter pallidiroseus TaxID=2072847 RepID=A0A369Q9B6_9BACT|nr:hypothetical protein AHMF7616_00050 [Adhaeribacter pallidiroseus]
MGQFQLGRLKVKFLNPEILSLSKYRHLAVPALCFFKLFTDNKVNLMPGKSLFGFILERRVILG